MIITGTDIKMTRGDSKTIRVTLKKEGVQIPLIDGDIIYFTVKTSTITEEKTLQKIITEFADGTALIEITPADTKNLLFTTYIYDLQLTDAQGNVITLIKPSKFIISGEVTHE